MRLFKVLFISIIFIIASCSRTPEDIVKKYLNANTVEKRLACVKQDDDVIRLIRKRYTKDYFKDFKKRVKIKGIRFESIEVNPKEYIELVRVKVIDKEYPNDYENWIYYLTRDENDNYLIDWKAGKGIAEMTVKTLSIQRPRIPTLIYANAELTNYYNFEFGGTQRTNLSIKLFHENEFIDYVHGYVRRDSHAGKELLRILKDSDIVPITLKVSFTPYDRGGDVVGIDEFLHEYWGSVVFK